MDDNLTNNRLPILEELKLIDFDYKNIEYALSHLRIGQVPYYIDLSDKNEQEIKKAIDHLTKYFKNNNHNPLFPYPFYVIGKINKNDSIFPVLTDKSHLPGHFFSKSRRLKNKEVSLLNKNVITATKIAQDDLTNKVKEIKMIMRERADLGKYTKEAIFYEKILKQIKTND